MSKDIIAWFIRRKSGTERTDMPYKSSVPVGCFVCCFIEKIGLQLQQIKIFKPDRQQESEGTALRYQYADIPGAFL